MYREVFYREQGQSPNLPIVGHRIQEVHTFTQSQGLAQHDHALALDPSATHILDPIQDQLHTPREAERRAAITAHGPELMDTTDLASRSPPYRGYHSRFRSPQVFRAKSPTKCNIPQGETECEYSNRYREVLPTYDIKDYYGQSVDFRDPFEKEHYQERERKYH